ncbi:MAG: MarR family transcriptional regulator [Parvularculaceae bacterium]
MTPAERNALRAWLDLLTASNAIKKEIDAKLRSEFGITISRFDVLSALDRVGPAGQRASDLSKMLLVTDGATTQVVAPLIRDGFVARTPCPNDGRAVILKLTKKGQRLFVRMARVHKQLIDEKFASLTPNQISTLRGLLSKIDLPHLAAQDERNAA